MILRILTNLLQKLHDQDLLVLTAEHDSRDKETIAELAQQLAQQASQAQQGAQFSSWISSQIMEADVVEELYASDAQIYDLLSNITL